MAAADLASGRQRDWVLTNPWPWMAVALGLCVWGWLWACVFGARASDSRLLLVVLGLAAAGIAVTLRLNAGRAAFLAASLQRPLAMVLASMFAAAHVVVTGILIASVFALAETPVHPGLAVVLWCMLGPLSADAFFRCLGRLRRHEELSAGEEAGALLLLAAACAFVGARAFDLGPALADDWDSIRFFLRSLSLGIVIGAALVAASPRARRLQLSLMILFHFGGMCTASLAASPSPWLVTQIWIRIYRPYLEFMYLNNAYHFYAPEPGPSNFAWLRLIYIDADGEEVGVWHKIPRVDGDGRPQHPVALEYQRYIALTEGIVPSERNVSIVVIDSEGRADYADFFKRRMAAVPNAGIIVGVEKPAVAIPFDPQVPQAQQYLAPNQATRILLEAFARHGAALPHPDDAKDPEHPRYRLKSVKIYRVIHAIPGSPLIAAGVDPLRDPTLFRPFYMGEYSPEGKLIDPKDPFLYWLLPTMRVHRAHGVEIRNYAALHAGDPRWVRSENSQEWREPD